eukprot:SAG31_NODE_46274_length_255_cov_0.660256_1_plen_60_part_01
MTTLAAMAGRLPPLGAAVDVTCPPAYSVWRAVVVRHVSAGSLELTDMGQAPQPPSTTLFT